MSNYVAIIEGPDGRRFRYAVKATSAKAVKLWFDAHNYCVERGWTLLSVKAG